MRRIYRMNSRRKVSFEAGCGAGKKRKHICRTCGADNKFRTGCGRPCFYISAFLKLKNAGIFILKYRKALVRIVLLLLILWTVWTVLETIEETVRETLENAAEIRTREIIEAVVADSVHDILYNCSSSTENSCDNTEHENYDSDSGEIIDVFRDSEGRVTLVRLNTDMINRIGNELSRRVNNDIHDAEAQKIEVSIGTLIGNRILSQITPSITFKVSSISVSNISYRSEFKTEGINQTRYRVYLDIKTEARVTAPFMAENVKSVNQVMAAETVIVGDVPSTFANIPDEAMSDFVS